MKFAATGVSVVVVLAYNAKSVGFMLMKYGYGGGCSLNTINGYLLAGIAAPSRGHIKTASESKLVLGPLQANSLDGNWA